MIMLVLYSAWASPFELALKKTTTAPLLVVNMVVHVFFAITIKPKNLVKRALKRQQDKKNPYNPIGYLNWHRWLVMQNQILCCCSAKLKISTIVTYAKKTKNMSLIQQHDILHSDLHKS